MLSGRSQRNRLIKEMTNDHSHSYWHRYVSMTNLMRRTLGETIEIEVSGTDDLWQCQANPGQLENAIPNLALNARDAMLRGGKLTIETAKVKLDDTDVVAWNDASPIDYVMVSVSDTRTVT